MRSSSSKSFISFPDGAEIASALQSLNNPTTETIRELRRQFSKRLAKASARIVIRIALELLKTPGIVPRWVAYELVCHHRYAMQSLDLRTVEKLGRGIDSWGAVDTFACYIAGPAWREHQISDETLRKWARSEDRWWRRAALVCTVALNNNARGGSGDTARTLDICSRLVSDRDDMVVKALSWALRELVKREPDAVLRFLAEHQQSVAPRVRREVTNKRATGLKNPVRPR